MCLCVHVCVWYVYGVYAACVWCVVYSVLCVVYVVVCVWCVWFVVYVVWCVVCMCGVSMCGVFVYAYLWEGTELDWHLYLGLSDCRPHRAPSIVCSAPLQLHLPLLCVFLYILGAVQWSPRL